MISDAIAQQIGATVTGLSYSTTGGTVFVDHLPQTPDLCVAVYSVSADEPDARLPYDPVQFQVVVRAKNNELGAAFTKMDAIYSALQGLRNTALPDGTYLVFALALSASWFPMGEDENGRPRYSMDFRGETLNPTTERP